MSASQNGYRVLTERETYLWVIPVRKGDTRHYRLSPGYVGFVLAHMILWWHERIEPINTGQWDEWGWADRPIRESNETSNHASGTAGDVNAVRHPLGVAGTFRYTWQRLRISRRLRFFYRGRIRWGGEYHGRKDEMHIEINAKPHKIFHLARRLKRTPRGKRILRANPTQQF